VLPGCEIKVAVVEGAGGRIAERKWHALQEKCGNWCTVIQ